MKQKGQESREASWSAGVAAPLLRSPPIVRADSAVRAPDRAFTLLELLLVIFLIGLLAALLLPAIEKARQRAKQVACMSQLKQIGIAVTIFRHEHDDLLPANVPMAEGGVKEFFFNTTEELFTNGWERNYRFFQTFSNTLVSPKLLICPADRWHIAADTFEKMSSKNISYWVLVCRPSPPYSDIVTGDGFWDDLVNIIRRSGYTNFHLDAYHGGTRGNMLFLDGHVEQMGQESLSAAFRKFQERPAWIMPPADPALPPLAAEPSSDGAVISASPGPNAGPKVKANANPSTAARATAFDRLERFFQPNPTTPPLPQTPGTPSVPPRPDPISLSSSRLGGAGALVTMTNSLASVTTNSPGRVAAAQRNPDGNPAVANEPWPTAVARHVAQKTVRVSCFWLLLLGLAVLIGFQIHRRRARHADETSDQEMG